jgi:uncharacterized protein involved in exopolysaccharide biosynthesis
MNQNNNLNNNESKFPFEQSFSFSSWVRHWFKAIKLAITTNIKMVVLITFIGALLGLAYSILKPVRYNSEITITVEDSKSIGGGLLSSIGGSLGMDIGSLAGSGNGLLSGDNVLSLLKSRSMMA